MGFKVHIHPACVLLRGMGMCNACRLSWPRVHRGLMDVNCCAHTVAHCSLFVCMSSGENMYIKTLPMRLLGAYVHCVHVLSSASS